jgi:hypothetical protein
MFIKKFKACRRCGTVFVNFFKLNLINALIHNIACRLFSASGQPSLLTNTLQSHDLKQYNQMVFSFQFSVMIKRKMHQLQCA